MYKVWMKDRTGHDLVYADSLSVDDGTLVFFVERSVVLGYAPGTWVGVIKETGTRVVETFEEVG